MRKNTSEDGSNKTQCHKCVSLDIRVGKIENLLIDIKNRLVVLEKSHDGFCKDFTEDLVKVKIELANLDTVVADDPPAHREIIISNVPELKSETTLEVARLVLRNVDPSFNGSVVTKAHRVKAKIDPNYIKATIRSAKSKDYIIVQSRQKRCKVSDINLPANAEKLSASKVTQCVNVVQANKYIKEPHHVYVNKSVCKNT